jgi:rhamnosyltransferase
MVVMPVFASVLSPDSISVIIPTRNGAGSLPAVLSMLRRQSIRSAELLVIDSASEDTTCDIALDFGAKLVPIKKEDFDHGGTRSFISQQAKGDILVFLTQDAVPASVDAIEKLIAPLLLKSDIAVTYGRQLPNREANVSAAHLRMFNYPAESSVRCFEDRQKLGLKTIFVSNSFAAYRKSMLADVGYFKNGLIFGEDTCTVGRLLKGGAKIAYIADAAVYHSHNYSWIQDFKRAFDIGVLHSMEGWLIDTYGKAEKVGIGYIRSQYAALRKAGGGMLLLDFFGRNIFKYLGYKLGRRYRILPRLLIPSLSMHRSWWAGRGKSKDSSRINAV